MSSPTTYRLAAIDLDGTLLGPNKEISPANRDAIRKLKALGIEPVLATGRHYTTTVPFANELPEIEWLVCFQGAEAANVDRSRIVYRGAMDPELAAHLISIGREKRFTVLAYHGDHITGFDDNALTRRYTNLAGKPPELATVEEAVSEPVYKVIWLEDESRMPEMLATEIDPRFKYYRVQTHTYMLEFLPVGITKATGTAELARHLGIDPSQALGFGDALNDVPLFEWAGTSYGMPHGWPDAIAKATHIATQGDPETAFARAVAHVLEEAGLA